MAKRKLKDFNTLDFLDACDRLCGTILQHTMKGNLRGGVVMACLSIAHWEQHQRKEDTGKDWELTKAAKREWKGVRHDDLVTHISNHVLSFYLVIIVVFIF